MLALKQEMRGTMQRLPHNIKPQSNKAGEEESSASDRNAMARQLADVSEDNAALRN